MAIYNVEYMNEFNVDNGDLLDNMLEMCNQMMDAVEESTAAQRHYHTTSKDMSKYLDGSLASKYYDKKTMLGSMAVKKTAKETTPDRLNKAVDRGQKIADKMSDRYSKKLGIDAHHMSDREKEENRVQSIANIKGATGAAMARAAKGGYDVKGEFDKVREKEAKKKAIKETCLNILSIIDEL